MFRKNDQPGGSMKKELQFDVGDIGNLFFLNKDMQNIIGAVVPWCSARAVNL